MLLANPHVQISPEVFSEAKSDKTPTFDTDKWGNKMLDTLEERLTEKVEDLLPTIVKKFTKPWVDNFRKSQSEFKGEINKVFRDTLTVTLQETQHETVNAISAKQDAEAFEKKRRVSNIVIRGVPESDSDKTEIRKQEETDFNKYFCNLQAGEIIKVFRAGKRNENPTLPRPIIATVSSPELPNRLHKYGNGEELSEKIRSGGSTLIVQQTKGREISSADSLDVHYSNRVLHFHPLTPST